MKNKTKKISWDLASSAHGNSGSAAGCHGAGKFLSHSENIHGLQTEIINTDFFMYAKSIVFLILVAWMLIVLIDRGLIRGIKLKHWKLFIPLYIYGLMVSYLHGIFCGQGAFPERHVAAV